MKASKTLIAGLALAVTLRAAPAMAGPAVPASFSGTVGPLVVRSARLHF